MPLAFGCTTSTKLESGVFADKETGGVRIPTFGFSLFSFTDLRGFKALIVHLLSGLLLQ
jgi:hypothetical protein